MIPEMVRFLKLQIHSSTVSEANKGPCHSARCDIIPLSSLFADVPVLSRASVIFNTFHSSFTDDLCMVVQGLIQTQHPSEEGIWTLPLYPEE